MNTRWEITLDDMGNCVQVTRAQYVMGERLVALTVDPGPFDLLSSVGQAAGMCLDALWMNVQPALPWEATTPS